jgi:hypothetical protein
MRTIFTKVFCLFIFAITVTAGSVQPLNLRFQGNFVQGLNTGMAIRKIGDSTMKGYGTILGKKPLIFDYKTDKIQTRFSIQQAYVFGENNYGSDTISKNTINIYEAWLRYNFTKIFL